MKSYKVLNKQSYSSGDYCIAPIQYEDRFDIMKWRNEQIYHLRQNRPLTTEDQDNYFDTVISKLFEDDFPTQILFSYLKNGKCVGYGGLVHINWLDKNAEISFIMNTSLEEREFKLHWRTFLHLIEQVAFQELKLHKMSTYAFDLRPNLYSIFEGRGFNHEATLYEHVLFNDKYINVVIHSKINKNENQRR